MVIYGCTKPHDSQILPKRDSTKKTYWVLALTRGTVPNFVASCVPAGFPHVFPERRFVAGFFRRLLAYLTPHISHTYPSHHTYPTHIHSKRIPSIRIPPIRIRSTRIPPIRIHAMRIHSMRIHAKGLHQQEWQCM